MLGRFYNLILVPLRESSAPGRTFHVFPPISLPHFPPSAAVDAPPFISSVARSVRFAAAFYDRNVFSLRARVSTDFHLKQTHAAMLHSTVLSKHIVVVRKFN